MFPSREIVGFVEEKLVFEGGGLYIAGGWIRQLLEGVSVFDGPEM